MSKRNVAVLIGIMITVFVVIGCSGDSSTESNPFISASFVPPEEVTDNASPIVKFECSNNSVYPGTTVYVKVNVVDPEDDPLTIIYDCEYGAVSPLEDGTYQWTLPQELGIYPLCVTVNDGTNIVDARYEIEVSDEPTFGRHL